VLERATEGKDQMMGTLTGYSDIDRKTAGWQAGDFNILAARPSFGLTIPLESAHRICVGGFALCVNATASSSL